MIFFCFCVERIHQSDAILYVMLKSERKIMNNNNVHLCIVYISTHSNLILIKRSWKCFCWIDFWQFSPKDFTNIFNHYFQRYHRPEGSIKDELAYVQKDQE